MYTPQRMLPLVLIFLSLVSGMSIVGGVSMKLRRPHLTPVGANFLSQHMHAPRAHFIPRLVGGSEGSIKTSSIFAPSPSRAGVSPTPLLLRRINAAGLKVIFMLLMWRGLGNLDDLLALQDPTQYMRLPRMVLSGALLCANMFGLLLSFLQPINFKNQLKLLLGANMLQEGGQLLRHALNVLLPSGGGSGGWSRQEHVLQGLVSFWWLSLCFAYTRSRWTLDYLRDDDSRDHY